MNLKQGFSQLHIPKLLHVPFLQNFSSNNLLNCDFEQKLECTEKVCCYSLIIRHSEKVHKDYYKPETHMM